MEMYCLCWGSVHRRPTTDFSSVSPAADVDETCTRLSPRLQHLLTVADADAGPPREDVAVPVADDDLRNWSLKIGFCGPAARATAGAHRECPPAVDVVAAAEDDVDPDNESRCSK